MTSRRDPYIVLGVPRQASGDEIARAYKRAARTSHPDSGDAGSAERFQAVSDAYDVLRDPRRRAVYDRSHPAARSRTDAARSGSVRYAASGSLHIVLGRRPGRQRGEIEQTFRLALSFLRGIQRGT
jgi:curved DNA-binding protein CbpA